jgi:hypothetical protein
MKLKRLIASVLVFAFVLSIGGGMVFASNASDLPAPGSWNYDALVSAIENGVIPVENGLIRPTQLITVGDMYRYASNALGVTFNPPAGASAIATREAMFVLLAEITGAELAPGDIVDTYLRNFTDGASISAAARTDIAALIKAGYITGVVSGGTASLFPNNQLTRSEFAVLAHRIFGMYVNSPGTVSANVGNVTVRSPGVSLSNIIVSGDVIIGGNARTIDLNLNNTTVRGRMIVRGDANVTANARSTVGTIHSYADLTYRGDATTINVRENNKRINFSGGFLRTLNIEANNNNVTIGSGAEIVNVRVDGNSNTFTGAGEVTNASIGGRNNTYGVSNTTNVTNDHSSNTVNTLSGTFNLIGAQITGNTTIEVMFDADVQNAPVSAFTLSGLALDRTSPRSATPNSAVINTTNRRVVTLTFNNATFGLINNVNAGTIAVADTLTSSEKGSLGTRSIAISQNLINRDPVINWSAPLPSGSATVTSIPATGATRNFTIIVGATPTTLDFTSRASNITMPAHPFATLSYTPGTVSWSGWGGIAQFGLYLHPVNGQLYAVQHESSTGWYFYMAPATLTATTLTRHNISTNPNHVDSRWIERPGVAGTDGTGSLTIHTPAGLAPGGSTVVTITAVGSSTITYNITIQRLP